MRNRSRRAARRWRAAVLAGVAVALAVCGGERTGGAAHDTAAAAPPVLRAATATPAITDAQIAHIVTSINALDARFSGSARARSEEYEIVRFASTLLADHNALGVELARLAAHLRLGPAQHELVQQFRDDAHVAGARTDSLTGPAFDRAYLQREVSFHEALLAAMDETLIPAARSPELRTLLENMRPAVEAHGQRARQLLAGR